MRRADDLGPTRRARAPRPTQVRGAALTVALSLAAAVVAPAAAFAAPPPSASSPSASSPAVSPDACAACHVTATPRAAHGTLLTRHAGLACAACHLGDPTARDAAAAHVADGPQALLGKDHVAASCVRCHGLDVLSARDAPPESRRAAAALVSGAHDVERLGCPTCHALARTPLGASASGGATRPGPTLVAIGARGPRAIEGIVRAPASQFPGTTMPSYVHFFHTAPTRARDLVTYLAALRPESRRPALDGVTTPCTTCHAKDGGLVAGASRADHRCVELRAEADALRCSHCHAPDAKRRWQGLDKRAPSTAAAVPSTVAGSDDEPCPAIAARRPGCTTCHDGAAAPNTTAPNTRAPNTAAPNAAAPTRPEAPR